MNRSLRVWVLSDGLPGHVNQARGLIRRIAGLRDIEHQEHKVQLRWRLLRPLMRWVLNQRKSWAAMVVRSAYVGLPSSVEPPDLIVSAGGNTSFANVMLARQFGVNNFFMGSLRGLDAGLFTTVFSLQPLTSRHDKKIANNTVMPILPPDSDPSESTAEAQKLRSRFPQSRMGAVLVGGDGSGYRFTNADWQALAAAMNALSQQHRVVWLLTTSRRSGVNAEALLKRLLEPDFIAEAVWYQQDSRNRNSVFLHAADVVLCSEDSMSMLHEALAADAPVLSFAPLEARPPERYREKIQQLTDQGYVQRCSIAELNSLDLGAVLSQPRNKRPDWRVTFDALLQPLLDTITPTQ